MASTYENRIALLTIRKGKIWPVDITTIFPLIQSVDHMPIEKVANRNILRKETLFEAWQ